MKHSEGIDKAVLGLTNTQITEQRVKDINSLEDKLTSALNLLEIAIEERDKERAVKRELLEACKRGYKFLGRSDLKTYNDHMDYELIEDAIKSAEKEDQQ